MFVKLFLSQAYWRGKTLCNSNLSWLYVHGKINSKLRRSNFKVRLTADPLKLLLAFAADDGAEITTTSYDSQNTVSSSPLSCIFSLNCSLHRKNVDAIKRSGINMLSILLSGVIWGLLSNQKRGGLVHVCPLVTSQCAAYVVPLFSCRDIFTVTRVW